MDRKIGALSLRELAGFFLLVGLLLAGLLLSWYLGRQQGQVCDALEDSAWLALSGQWENARNTAEDARRQWEQNWHLRAAVTDHKPMEEIDSLFGELAIYSAAGAQTEFARTCTVLSRRLNALTQSQTLTWWNVL